MRSKDYILVRLFQRIADMYGPNDKPYKRTSEGRELFEQRSYAHWAAWEYYEQMRKASDIYFVSGYFVRKMDLFACSNHPNARMFSVAYDVATDLNDFLLTL